MSMQKTYTFKFAVLGMDFNFAIPASSEKEAAERLLYVIADISKTLEKEYPKP